MNKNNFTYNISQFTPIFHFSFIKQEIPSLEIENCKLKIGATGGSD